MGDIARSLPGWESIPRPHHRDPQPSIILIGVANSPVHRVAVYVLAGSPVPPLVPQRGLLIRLGARSLIAADKVHDVLSAMLAQNVQHRFRPVQIEDTVGTADSVAHFVSLVVVVVLGEPPSCDLLGRRPQQPIVSPLVAVLGYLEGNLNLGYKRGETKQ